MFTVNRIGEITNQLSQLRYPDSIRVQEWKIQIQHGETRPDPSIMDGEWTDIPPSGIWGGDREYRVFRGKVVIPEHFHGKCVDFQLLTGQEGQWDATNPQFSVYVDGVLRQGFDVNHTALRLTDNAVAGTTYDLFLSAFTGTQNFHLQFNTSLRTVDPVTEKLYYDLLIPWQVLCLLEKDDPAYLELAEILTGAVNLLDMRKPGSKAYYESKNRTDDCSLCNSPSVSYRVILMNRLRKSPYTE